MTHPAFILCLLPTNVNFLAHFLQFFVNIAKPPCSPPPPVLKVLGICRGNLSHVGATGWAIASIASPVYSRLVITLYKRRENEAHVYSFAAKFEFRYSTAFQENARFSGYKLEGRYGFSYIYDSGAIQFQVFAKRYRRELRSCD